jgi:elongation factor 1-alpha
MKAVFFIQDVYNITGLGPVPVGQVKEGIIKLGMQLNVNGKVMEIKSIEMHHEQLKEANQGYNVGIALRNGDYNLLKQFIRKDVVFTDEPSPKVLQTEQDIKPEGAFGFLNKIFRKI